jgi:hypothetical protein
MDPRLDAAQGPWAAESSFTEAAPRAGLPEPSGAYSGSLRATGEQTAAFTARVQSAGMPGGTSSAATFATSPDGSTKWAGWEGPGSVSFWEALTFSTSNPHSAPSICTTPTGTLLVAARKGASLVGDLVVYRKTVGQTGWSTAITVPTRGLVADSPAIVVVGARVMIFAGVTGTVGGTYLWSLYSDDDGATWAEASAPAGQDFDTIQEVTAGDLRRIRGAYANGQIILLAHTRAGTTNTTYQWASDDLGASFTRVATIANEGYGDVVASAGQFVAITSVFAGGSASTRVRRYGSAFQAPSAAILSGAVASASGLGSAYLTDTGSGTVSRHNGFALVVDEPGTLYAFAVFYAADPDTATHRGQVFFSEDQGASWAPWGMDTYSASDASGYAYSARWWAPNSGDTGTTPERVGPTAIAACAHRGRIVVAHNWVAPTSTYGSSLAVAFLGGLSTVTLPPINRGARYADQASWDWTYLPYEEPENLPNTLTWTGLGATTAIAAPGHLQISTSGANGYGTFVDPFSLDPTARATVGDTLIAEAAFDAVANPDTTTDRIALKLRVDDGVYGYQVSVRVNTVAVVVYDDVLGAQIMASATLATGPKSVRVGLDGSTGQVTVWVRPWNADEVREWTLLDTVALSDDGGTVGFHRLQFGHFGGPPLTTVTSRWYFVAVSFGDRAGYSNVGTQAHWDNFDPADVPANLKGRQLAAPPRLSYARSQAALSGVRGPFYAGQTWTVTPDATFAAKRILPQVSRSPRLGWRSTGDNIQQTIALQLSDLSGAAVAPVMALVLRGINWRAGSIQARIGGVWTIQAYIDAGLNGVQYTFARTGDVLKANSYSASAPYLATGELRGWTAAYGTNRRKIRHNTEGKWASTTYTGPLASVIVEGATSGDAASGSMRFWSPDVAVLFPFTATADGWRIVIDAQQTADDYYTIGQVVLGPLHLLAQPYGWGRTQTTERGSQIEIQPDRTTYLSRPAPARRVIQMTWSDGVDETQMWATEPAPDYPDYDSNDASNANAATLQSLSGLLNEADGRMVALLPKVTLPITTTQTIWRKAGIIVGTASVEDQIDTIQGEELTDEVVRSGNLVITEEV